MRTRRIVAATVAAAVVGTGVVVTPMVLAADNDDTTPQDRSGTSMPYGPRWADDDGDFRRGPGGDRSWMRHRWQEDGDGWGRGMGPGMMQGRGGPGMMQGRGAGPGDCLYGEDGVAQGTLTADQEATLLEQLEHEKVARDVYLAFSESTGDYRFERVALSEQHHLDALRMLADRYDLTDPTKGLDEGEFETDAFQEQYDAYVAQGDDLAGALKAAQTIEKEDIADLRAAAKGLDAPDVERVYENQLVASQHHLEVFSR